MTITHTICIGSYLRQLFKAKPAPVTVFLLCTAMTLILTKTTLAADVQAPATDESQQQHPPASDGAGIKEGPSPHDPKKIIVARVNGVGITLQAVLTMTNRLIANKGEGDGSPESMKEMKKQALNRLILQELALQQAKAEGVTIEEERISHTIAAVKDKLGGEEGYENFLEKEGMTEQDLKMQIVRNLTLEKIYTLKVLDKITISEDEIKETYEKEKARYHTPEKVSILDVVLFLDPDDKDSQAKAEEVLKKIKEDKDQNPHDLVLDGTFVVRDLDVKKDKDRELYEEARKLKVGELSGVIRTSESLDIIKLTHYSPEKQFTLDEARGYIEAQLRVRGQQKRSLQWEAELKKGAAIEILDAPEEANP